MNPLSRLQDAGQSVWLDAIRRGLIQRGELARLIERDRLRGVTSNPAIFEKAIAGSNDYHDALATLAAQGVTDAAALYERLAIEDIQAAADVFRGVYEESGGLDGYVSLEVSPRLAYDAEATCAEARRLWAAIGRPNAMIKVPATPAGIPTVERLIAEGINVNVTLLFARAMYEQAAEAYLRGLERRVQAGQPVDRIASVASFFVSRIDAAVGSALRAHLEAGVTADEAQRLRALGNKIAVANAKLAYQAYRRRIVSERWRALAARGARPQRLLWASTGTKDPSLSDVYYLETLIGSDTVTTVPTATYDAFHDHGRVAPTLEADLDDARATLEALGRAGIGLDRLTDELLEQGVTQFQQAFDRLLSAVADIRRTTALAAGRGHRLSLPAPLQAAVDKTVATWQREDRITRLWRRDATLWTGDGEGAWLGWLCATEDRDGQAHYLNETAAALRDRFRHLVLLGMGGSSLAPEVFARTFGRVAGAPALHVLDSTSPAQIDAVERALDPEHTLFIVSSKSGSTLEPNLLLDHFHERVATRRGREAAGAQFVAITDPGSSLEDRARALGFRHVFRGRPDIGGRYSALSNFGLVPAALMGLDVGRLLDRADEMAQACSGCVPAEDNPGLVLGAVIGAAARAGRDKLTLIASPGIAALGGWIEQLIAESTGKQGRGVIPVDDEPFGPPSAYGEDRLFVYLRLDEAADAGQDAAVERLADAGQPVVRLRLRDRYDLGREFFRWEIATAVAGSVLGINPFDQPDVEASKIATRALMQQYARERRLPSPAPLVAGPPGFYTDAANEARLRGTTGTPDAEGVLRAHLQAIQPGDYFALLAYLAMTPAHHERLQAIRAAVRDATGAATCLGYGPRFLHSTGQAYKGGSNRGVFLQVTADGPLDPPVPGQSYSFGTAQTLQALGDFQVLLERGRRALRVHLGKDPDTGLAQLDRLVQRALSNQKEIKVCK